MISSFMIGGTVPILCIISLCLFRPKSTCGGLKLALFIGVVLPTYFLLGLCCPLTFYWGCAAHLLFIGVVLPTYFLLGLCCPLTFYWGCAAHLLFIGVVLPTYFLLGLCCPLTFYWGCAAHLLFIGAVLPTYFLFIFCICYHSCYSGHCFI